jgi:hypothetical protein
MRYFSGYTWGCRQPGSPKEDRGETHKHKVKCTKEREIE